MREKYYFFLYFQSKSEKIEENKTQENKIKTHGGGEEHNRKAAFFEVQII